MKTRVLRVGALQAELEDGGLRYITYHGIEIVRGIYAAVRDRGWGTVSPRFASLQTEEGEDGSTIVAFTCEHVEGDIDFVWKGSIRLTENEVRFDFDGQARSSFLKNRVGFCILHPMEFAGLAVDVQTGNSLVQGMFPQAVSPHQPYKEMKSMSYDPAPGLHVAMNFEGELFEMEDQRNWTDASYKTYCTPLELPFPVLVEKGQSIRQSVTVSIFATSELGRSDLAGLGHRVVLQQESVCRLPDIGFGLADIETNAGESALLEQLHPDYLRLAVDLTHNNWRERLEASAVSAGTMRCGLELEVIIDSAETTHELAAWLAQHRLPVLRLLPFRHGTYVSEPQVLQSVRHALMAAGLPIPVGAGTRTYYAEFNRAVLPLAEMDFAAYSINPQVHAFDNRSIMETLSTQAITACDAEAKSGKPLYIGPVTLKPRINPNATSGAGISQEDQRDARQRLLFGAAWSLGSVAALCLKAVKGITYFETVGPVGLVEDAQPNPLYQVFKDITECSGAEVMSVHRTSTSITALVLKTNGTIRVLLANITAEELEVELETGAYRSANIVVYQDENMKPEHAADPKSEEIRLSFAPYGYACIDLEGSWISN